MLPKRRRSNPPAAREMNQNTHNFRQKRGRLMREIREAHTAIIWHLSITTPQGKRARTLAAKRLMERSRDLWRLLSASEIAK